MNRKQFFLLLGLVAVIGTVGLFLYRRDNHSWHHANATLGGKLLPGLAINDVAQITIQSGAGELNLAKRDNLWRVRERGDYPANFTQISELLIKFGDLKIAQSQEVGPSQLGRFQLLPPGAGTNASTLIEFKDQGGKVLASVRLGKPHLRQAAANAQFGGEYPDGRYVMVGSDAKSLAVISDPLDTVQPRPEAWLSKDFFSIEKPTHIAVQFPVATNSWQLTRATETNDWELMSAQPGEKLDATKVAGVTRPFSATSFNDVAAPDAPAELTQPTNGLVMTVGTADGFTYTAHIGNKHEETYPVRFTITADQPASRPVGKDEKPEDQAKLDQNFKNQQTLITEKLNKEKAFTSRVYYLPAYEVEELLKPRSQLLVETKKEETPTATSEK